MEKYRVPLCFGGFALLIAMRDVAIDLMLNENSIALAFATCATIVVLSLINLAVLGSFRSLAHKLCTSPRLMFATVGFGVLSGVMYAVAFHFVQSMGAGLFNIIDYGLTPLLTAAVGIYFIDKKKQHEQEQKQQEVDEPKAYQLAIGFLFYFVGVVMLVLHRGMGGVELIWLALLVPLATAATDGMMRWLQTPKYKSVESTLIPPNPEPKIPLTSEESLIVRFVPATLVLFVFAMVGNTGFTLQHPVWVIAISAVCGFIPLWLLAVGLRKGELQKLALWEFLIPAICFFGTLHAHPENVGILSVSGAVLVLVAFVVGHLKPPIRRLANSLPTPDAQSESSVQLSDHTVDGASPHDQYQEKSDIPCEPAAHREGNSPEFSFDMALGATR